MTAKHRIHRALNGEQEGEGLTLTQRVLFATIVAAVAVAASSALYVIEGSNHPDAFGSILRSMWWAVVTLTTVGYGDVVPLSPLGKVFAAITAIAGIGMIAMPTGILAAAFSEGFAKARHQREAGTAGPRAGKAHRP